MYKARVDNAIKGVERNDCMKEFGRSNKRTRLAEWPLTLDNDVKLSGCRI
jgi:hypothetical protein